MRESARTMTVEIEFAGMCLFTHLDGRMYVLLPTVDTAHHGENAKHLVRLFYTHADRKGGDAAQEVVNGNEYFVTLNRAEQRILSTVERPEAAKPADSWLVNLTDEEPKRSVRPELLTGPVSESLVARVVLNAGRLQLEPYRGTTWEYAGRRREMAISGHWTIQNVPAPLSLEISNGKDIVLDPDSGLLKIQIFNATDRETPRSDIDPAESRDASHFTEFGKLLDRPLPDPPRNPDLSRAPLVPKGRLFTCIMAQAEA